MAMAQAAINTYRFLEELQADEAFSPVQANRLAKALDVSQADADFVTNSQMHIALNEVKLELRAEIAGVRTEIATSANRTILWVVGANAAMYAGLFALLGKALHWFA